MMPSAIVLSTRDQIVALVAAMSPDNVNDIAVLQSNKMLPLLVRAFNSVTVDTVSDVAKDVAARLPSVFPRTVWATVLTDPVISQNIASLVMKNLLASLS